MTHQTDNENYKGANSGCEVASAVLGHPSFCLECPLDECIYDISHKSKGRPLHTERDAEIKKRKKAGESIKNLALMFNLSKRRIQGILYEGVKDD